MSKLEDWIRKLENKGYNQANAEAKVCQDIVLKAIGISGLSSHVTIKGGVVIRSITGSIRRATQDLDLDFIRYSLEEDAIHRFIDRLNCLEGIRISISAPIEELSQQEYRGKRVYVIITDDTGHSLRSKIDLGVHKQMQVDQDEYCFDVCMVDEGASLLINSKEQIFAEKLRSLLRFGPLSTRYKDIFDLYYLSDEVNKDRLAQCLTAYIFSDPGMRENDEKAIRDRLHQIFHNRQYRQRLERSSHANWQKISVQQAFDKILSTFL